MPDRTETAATRRRFRLADLPILAKLLLSSGVILLIIGGLAAAVVQEAFATAGQRTQVVSIVEQLYRDLLELRRGVREFAANGRESLVPDIERAAATLTADQARAMDTIRNPGRRAKLQDVAQQIEFYITNMHRVVAAKHEQGELILGSLDPSGTTLLQRLEGLMPSLSDALAVREQAHAGVEALLKGRLAANKTLARHDAAFAAEAAKSLGDLQHDLADLQAALPDPQAAAAIAEMMTLARTYQGAFQRAEDINAMSDALVNDTMRHAAEQAQSDLNEIHASASAEREQVQADAERLMATLRARVLLLAAIGAVLGCGFSVLVGRGIAGPIRALTATMRRVAHGEFDVVLPYLQRRDEVGGMANALRVFRQNAVENNALRAEREAEHDAAAVERRQSLLEMAQVVESETGSIIGTISSLTGTVSNSAVEMAAAAERTGEHSRTAATAAQVAIDNAKTVTASTDALSRSISEITDQVALSTQVVRRAVAAGAATRSTIAALSEKMGRIGAVAEMISGIASKTNLLALNATIEAARAGEAGKGFAVVAGEVKQLASQTGRSTTEISQSIAEIRQATVASLDAVTQIERTTTELQDIAGLIAAAVARQGAATGEIATNVAGSSVAARDVADRIALVIEEAERTGVTALDVNSTAEGLSIALSGMRGVISKLVRTASVDTDRRRSKRFSMYQHPATVTALGQTRRGSLRDLSDDGAAVLVDMPLIAGVEGSLQIDDAPFPLPFETLYARNGVFSVLFKLDETQAASFRGFAERLSKQSVAA